jgi:hypothetical protein
MRSAKPRNRRGGPLELTFRERDTIAMLQLVIQNGAVVAWAFAALFTGFALLTGKV